MRYSFHGKVRLTGQLVDGYVEAETSTEAIDRLADQGIIGVYSVRAEPKQPRNPVLLAGTPEFERALYADAAATKTLKRSGGSRQPALPAPVVQPAPVEPPAPTPIVAAPVATAGVSDGVMLQLVDKLSVLIGQMQKMLDRPVQVVYQQGGPAREGKGKRAPRAVNDAQNSTLRDIFQNNLDLRRSLQKLAETVTPAAEGAGEAVAVNGVAATDGTVAAADAAPAELLSADTAPDGATDATPADEPRPDLLAHHEDEGDEEQPPPGPDGGLTVGADPLPDLELTPLADGSADEAGDELSMHVHELDHARHAQPAA